MAKTWEQMNDSERTEDLRRDLLKTMNFSNDLKARVGALEIRVSAAVDQIHDLESQVVKMERRKSKR